MAWRQELYSRIPKFVNFTTGKSCSTLVCCHAWLQQNTSAFLFGRQMAMAVWGGYDEMFHIILICFSSMDILCGNPICHFVDAGVPDHRDGV